MTEQYIYRDRIHDRFYLDREKDYHRRDYCYDLVIKTDKRIVKTLIDAFDYQKFLRSPQYGKEVAIISSPLVDVDIDSNLYECVGVSHYGMWYTDYSLDDQPIEKDFNCFINRMDSIRQSWLYLLKRRNLLDQGFVSFNMDISRIPYLSHLTEHEAFEFQFQKDLSIFDDEHNYLKSLVPYKNFTESPDITAQIMASKIGICLETYVHDNHVISLSEKIFRHLQVPRPWILFSVKGAVQHLREAGFDVLDDVVAHDRYDNVEHIIQRQAAILDLVQDLRSINIAELYPRLRQAAEFNQQLLKKWLMTWDEDFKQSLTRVKYKLDQLDKK